MSSPTQWVLTNKPTDLPELSGPNQTFTLETASLPSLNDDQVLVRSLYISNDPAQLPQDGIMRARSIAQVVESKSSNYSRGDKVLATTGWAEYSVQDAVECQACEDIPGLSATHYLGAFGLTGLTAYYGTKIIARVGREDTVVVSGAAGATGSMVVQIAKKMLGCKKVVDIAGSDDKAKWVESLGADVCLNYKKFCFKQDLVKATDGFVEVYFDNVGGEILDLMLMRMKQGGRIAACGAITDYNRNEKQTTLKNWFEDFWAEGKGPQAVKEMVTAAKEGKIKVGEENETVVDNKFEDVPKTWMSLLEGANTGKLVTKLV
ncbi:hypothetical protein HO133_000924 [Letharia lupina]|uniref:Enoyl reductase (ER) domain-containing protein n=1 Tax=Letharia lupina TaxID=560253 RepID=A0A8H6FCH8_9LECA|nr:uncharacterized protein HO133_000924 [Letharia lupina]KAF6222873.1 hypothetical protein HO133_000924 [Letharia lupina]